MKFKDVKTLFFDYDGTLHNSMAIYEPAFLKAYQYLLDNDYVKPYPWTSVEISRFLGQTPKDMWDKFGKDLPETIKAKASQMISLEMARLIKDNQAILYDGALETLQILKDRGYQLVFISNCKQYYLDAHTDAFNLGKLFDLMVCSETFDVEEKHLVLANIIKDFPKDYVIIGDRYHDMDAGNYNQIYKIGCRYGFGDAEELADADVIIDDINALRTLFN